MAELSQAQKRAVAKESWWYWYYHGTLVHRATANKLREQYPGRFVYQPIGVDFFDKLTNTWGGADHPGAHRRAQASGRRL